MKSAYHLVRRNRQHADDSVRGSSSRENGDNWDFIWHVKLPPKIKIFGWRLLKSALPILNNLRRHHIVSHVMCPVCECGDESILHIFRDCHFVRITWAISPIPNSLLFTDSNSPWDWFQEIRSRTTSTYF